MNAPNKPGANGAKVEIFKLANTLKERMGLQYNDQTEGFLPPETIEEAEQLITRLCATSPAEIGKNLDSLILLWEKMKAMPESPERAEMAARIFTVAHEIKDVGAMCGFELIAHFAESLRDYIAQTQLSMTAQVVIIQAHLDAMLVVHHKGFRNNAGPEAEELKRIVKMAIEKYH